MAEVLIVGSMALDTVETPFGKVEDIVGGAGVYASIAASFFAPVNLIGVVGDDYPQASLDFLADRGISLDGVVVVPGGQTFRWAGRYEYDMSSAHTLDTQLGVFADFAPRVPESYHHSRYVFLANILPSVQLAVIEQIPQGCFVIADTMNFWIERARDDLYKVLERVDLMLLNDAEIRQLTGEPNLARAATEVLKMGPQYVIIKKGEYGATLVSEAGSFTLPCYPLQDVLDPTGAGDSFAGGFIGYLAWAAACGDPDLRRATAIGTVMASRCVESFGLDSLADTTTRDIYDRYFALKRMVEFQELPEGL
jgi:sugar/nucleoside kinase (ribokinase family)